MKFFTILRAGLAAIGICLLTTGGRAQQADPQSTAAAPALSAAQEANRQNALSILERGGKANQQNKVSQTDYTMDLSAGSMGALSFHVHSYHAYEKSRLEFIPVGQGVGEVGKKAAQLRCVQICDGKTQYSLANDTYIRTPATKETKENSPLSFLSDPSFGDCVLLSPITLNGHPVYVIRVSSKDKDAPAYMTAFIDQDSYQLRKLEIVLGAPSTDEKFQITLNAINIVNNPTLPASLFKFTPPKGVKETKEPAGVASNPFQAAMASLAAQNSPKAK